jgi:HK97 family phage major capsid protein
MSAFAKQLREKLAKLSLDMTAIVDRAKSENNRGLTSEEATKWDALEADFSATETMLQRVEKTDKIAADLASVAAGRQIAGGAPSAGAVSRDRLRNRAPRPWNSQEYADAFDAYMCNPGGLTPEAQAILAPAAYTLGGSVIRNTMSTGTGSQGGYAIPTGFSDLLEEALKWYGGILGTCGMFETETGAPLPWPTINDTGNSGRIIGQNVQVTNTDLVFGQVNFGSYIFSSDIVLLPLALLQDSYFDLNEEAAKLLGVRLGRILNNKLTVGAGGGTEPTGLQTAVAASGNSTTGAVGQTTSVIYDDLVNLEHTVDPLYRPQGKYMFHDSTFKVIKKLKDGQNRPLWQPGIYAGFSNPFPQTILDHPFVINNDMPVMAANAKSILFGDFSKYKVRRVAGGTTILRLTERYADYLQVGIVAFLRADGNLVDAGTHPIGYYANSAT